MSARVVPLGRVLRAADAQLYNDASAALECARLHADTLRGQAEAQLAAERAQVQAEARQAAEAEVARALAAASASITRELAGMRAAVADAIADGVAAILGARPPAEVAARAAAHAIASLQDRTGITLRVPLALAATIEAALSMDGLRVQADATLGEDELVIETAAGFVRGGVRAQLARLREALRDAAEKAPMDAR